MEYYGRSLSYLEERNNAIYSKQKLTRSSNKELRLRKIIAKNLVVPQPPNVRNPVVKIREMERFGETKGDQRSARFEFTVELNPKPGITEVNDVISVMTTKH